MWAIFFLLAQLGLVVSAGGFYPGSVLRPMTGTRGSTHGEGSTDIVKESINAANTLPSRLAKSQSHFNARKALVSEHEVHTSVGISAPVSVNLLSNQHKRSDLDAKMGSKPSTSRRTFRFPWQKASVPTQITTPDTTGNKRTENGRSKNRIAWVHAEKGAYHPMIQRGFERFEHMTEVLGRAVDKHKGRLRVVGNLAVAGVIGWYMARRIANWYRGISDLEQLLDARDQEYHAHGGILYRTSATLLGSANHTMLAELNCEQLYERLVGALDRPCLPQTMQSYSMQAGRATAVLLSDIDVRIRSYRRKVSRLRAARPRGGVEQSSVGQGKASVSVEQEGQVLLMLQRGVALLQARQADAYLRVTRTQLLTAANALEDLLAAQKQRPFVHSAGKGLLSSRLSALRTVNAASKAKVVGSADTVLVIEGMLAGIYSQAAVLQRHLDSLRPVETALEGAYSQETDSSVAWSALEDWVSAASTLAAQSAALMRGEEVIIQALPPSLPPKVAEINAAASEPTTRVHGATRAAAQAPVATAAETAASAAGTRLSVLEAPQRMVDWWASVLTSTVAHSHRTIDTNLVIAQLALLVLQITSNAQGPGTEALVGDFTLPGDVATVVEKCVVNSQPILSALEKEGHTVTHVQAWEPVHRNNLSFVQHLAQLDAVTLNASLLNNMWYREVRYKDMRTNLLVERDRSERYLLQVLNTAGKIKASANINATAGGGKHADVGGPSSDGNSGVLVGTSAVLLALFVDLSAHSLYADGSNCTMKWVFSPVSSTRTADYGDMNGAARTRVRVTMTVQSPAGLLHTFDQHHAQRHAATLLQRWRAAALDTLTVKKDISQDDNAQQEREGAEREPPEVLLLQSLREHARPAERTVPTPSPQLPHRASTAPNSDLLRLVDDDGTVYFHPLPALNPSTPLLSLPALQGTAHPQPAGDRAEDPLVLSQRIQQTFQRQRGLWRVSGVILQELQKAPAQFADHLAARGLQRRSRRGLLGLLRPRLIFRLVFWSAVAAGGLGLTKRTSKLSFRAEAVAQHVNSFVERRVVRPLTNILNDVVLNKRVSITDHTALKDAKRSLSAMIYDFLQQHCKSMSEGERKRIASTMDMRPISEEYEHELRRPMQSIVSGKIARLVLIQLQFVKKELLVAMQAIDDLFNANQVNLQLLAITPAVLSIVSLNILWRTLLAAFRATSRGRKVESSAAIHRELRDSIRALERVLVLSSITPTSPDSVPLQDMGKILSGLHRMQWILAANTNFLDRTVLRQLQEDLRDLILPELTVEQRLALVGRIYGVFPQSQAGRNIWGSAFIQ